MVISFWTMSTGRTIMKMSTTTIERVSIITCGHLRTWSMHIITSLQTIIIKPIWTTLVTWWHDQCITSIKAGWDVDLVNLLVGLGRQMDFDDHTRWLVAFIIFIVLPSSGFFNKQDIILVGVTWHMAAPRQHYDVHKGSCHLRFSGFCPLRGGGVPPNSVKEKILPFFTLIFR